MICPDCHENMNCRDESDCECYHCGWTGTMKEAIEQLDEEWDREFTDHEIDPEMGAH